MQSRPKTRRLRNEVFMCATRQSTGAEAEHAGVCARAGQIEAEHREEAERRGRGPRTVFAIASKLRFCAAVHAVQ